MSMDHLMKGYGDEMVVNFVWVGGSSERVFGTYRILT